MTTQESGTKDAMQFDTAELPAGGGGASCSLCHAAIPDSYYEINGRVACAACRSRIEESVHGGSPGLRFVKALAAGLAASLAGAAVWFAVAKFANIEAGLIAILIGFLVARGIRWGTEGRSGTGYRVMAVLLTYFAIATAYMLLVATDPSIPETLTWPSRVFLGYIIGVQHPFRGGVSNILGIVIIGIALYEAWKLSAGVTIRVTGPYQVAAPGGRREG